MKPVLLALGIIASFALGAVWMDIVWTHRIITTLMTPGLSAPPADEPRRSTGTIM